MEREKEILEQLPDGAVGAKVLEMTERGESLGHVAVQLEGQVLHLLRFFVKNYDFSQRPDAETVFFLDTLMRSAASFGETHGANRIEVDFPDFFDFFRLRGFQSGEKGPMAPMSLIVSYSNH